LVLYELDYKNPILYIIPVESILGKLPVIPVGDAGPTPHNIRSLFTGAPGDSRGGSEEDVVCLLVGFGLVPWYVIMAYGVEGTLQDGGGGRQFIVFNINYVDYISYFNCNELVGIIDTIW
jgi:hypothetical protein